MSRPFSSKNTSKPSPPTAPSPVPGPSTAKIDRRRKKKNEEQSRRNPLHNLNGTITTPCSSSEASSVSVEAPRGCLRFFLSHAAASSSSFKTPVCRARAHSKTPKSNPITRPSLVPSKSKENVNKGRLLKNMEKPISRTARLSNNSPSFLYKWQSGKKPSSKTAQVSKNSSVLNSSGNVVKSGSELRSLVSIVGDVSEFAVFKSCGNDEKFTPLSKISSALRLDCTAEKAVEEKSNEGNSKTPPIQASVSPEIQCGSSMVSTTTPACYGAGHVVSGITDKRKCRSRGILSVGERENDAGFRKGKALGSFDDDDLDDYVNVVTTSSDTSMVPLPAEASMHWLLSPCKEDDDDHKQDSENGSCQFESLSGSIVSHSPFSPSSGHRFSSDVCISTSITDCARRKSSTLISPSRPSDVQEFLDPVNGNVPVLSTPGCKDVELVEGLKYPYDLDGKTSFSMESLGSGNAVRTPKSDSSTDCEAGSSWLGADKHKTMPSLCRNCHASVKEHIDLSFQFDFLATSCNSVDLTQFQHVLHDHGPWNSSSTLETVSQSQMRLSWREGLVSQICETEMDEFDCCRCLSDEEEDAFGCSNDQLKSCQSSNVKDKNQILTNQLLSAKVLDNDVVGVEGKDKASFPPGRPQLSCPGAESISIDGGSLLASEDSDWTLCYKNELFEV